MFNYLPDHIKSVLTTNYKLNTITHFVNIFTYVYNFVVNKQLLHLLK